MQVGDTSQTTYTPYQFLEFYNEGNHLLHSLVIRYLPFILTQKSTDFVTSDGIITVDKDVLSIENVIVDGQVVDNYTVTGVRTLQVENDGKEHTISVDYIPSAGYKKIDDESGYPSEIESMLVYYMVARILKADLSFTQGWGAQLSQLGNNLNGGAFIGRGYYLYDRRRTDYAD